MNVEEFDLVTLQAVEQIKDDLDLIAAGHAQVAIAAKEASETAAGISIQNADKATTKAEIATQKAEIATNKSDIATSKAQEANTSEVNAAASEQSALSSKNAAKASEDASKLSETNAGNSATAALQAKTAAETARDESVSAKNLAQAAKTAAETAKSGADIAQNKAMNWSEKEEDSPVEEGKYSAKHYASKALSAYAELPNVEHALADIIAHLLGRIQTLEELLTVSAYNTIQVNELSVVDNLKVKGAYQKLFGTGAPIVTPDFAGQEYLDQTAKIWYDAVGVVNAGDWKPRTNV